MSTADGEPPYWAVIFTSQRSGADATGYGAAAARMLELAAAEEGFLGVESVRDAAGRGITISYWRDLDAIRRWRDHPEHAAVRAEGRRTWYEHFRVRVCRVERDEGGGRDPDALG